MFYTWPEAQQSSALTNPGLGDKTWRWVELAIAIPLFLIHVRLKEEDSTLDRHLLFGQLRDALEVINQKNDSQEIIGMSLLSPGYMNGSDDFQLGKVSEIWRDKTSTMHKYVLDSGQSMTFDLFQRTVSEPEMELMLSF
jgi:hypothetical protein